MAWVKTDGFRRPHSSPAQGLVGAATTRGHSQPAGALFPARKSTELFNSSVWEGEQTSKREVSRPCPCQRGWQLAKPLPGELPTGWSWPPVVHQHAAGCLSSPIPLTSVLSSRSCGSVFTLSNIPVHFLSPLPCSCPMWDSSPAPLDPPDHPIATQRSQVDLILKVCANPNDSRILCQLCGPSRPA